MVAPEGTCTRRVMLDGACLDDVVSSRQRLPDVGCPGASVLAHRPLTMVVRGRPWLQEHRPRREEVMPPMAGPPQPKVALWRMFLPRPNRLCGRAGFCQAPRHQACFQRHAST